MHTVSSYRSNRPTNKQTNPQNHTQIQDQLQYIVPLSLAYSIKIVQTEMISDVFLKILCNAEGDVC